MRFTKPLVAALALPEGKSELIIFDDTMPGFGARLRAGGKRTWIVQYRIGKKQRRLTLGAIGTVPLEAARRSAGEALSKVGLAIDPQADKMRSRAGASVTLRVVADRYLAFAEAKQRPRSFVETQRHLKKAWAPLHELPIAEVERATIANRLGVLSTDNGPVAADRARAALSACFTWAMKEGLVENNPVTATNRPHEPKSRERTLSDDELIEIWRATGEDAYGRIVRLLILTGQRRDEVGGMAWSELALDKALWSIPAGRTKNNRPHDIPLSDGALAILRAVPSLHDQERLFSGGRAGFSGWSNAKAALDRRIAAARTSAAEKTVGRSSKVAQMPAWRLHDLRRTVATRMADLGVGPHVIEALLNHVSGTRAGVAGVYNRSVYAAEKRMALTLWGAHVERLVSGEPSGVVPLRRAAERHQSMEPR